MGIRRLGKCDEVMNFVQKCYDVEMKILKILHYFVVATHMLYPIMLCTLSPCWLCSALLMVWVAMRIDPLFCPISAQKLQEALHLHEFKRVSSDLEDWISQQRQIASSEDYGTDYNNVLVRMAETSLRTVPQKNCSIFFLNNCLEAIRFISFSTI